MADDDALEIDAGDAVDLPSSTANWTRARKRGAKRRARMAQAGAARRAKRIRELPLDFEDYDIGESRPSRGLQADLPPRRRRHSRDQRAGAEAIACANWRAGAVRVPDAFQCRPGVVGGRTVGMSG